MTRSPIAMDSAVGKAGEGGAAAYAAVQDYLFSLKTRGVKFGVDRMRLLARALGDPERAVPCVHVAGTNGKGSVSAMLDSIFRAAGWRAGLYTSPHLVRLGERVQVDRKSLTEDEIVAWVRELRPIAESLAAVGGDDDHPSFFEFMTATAFLQFARSGCDVSVIEVGLGGRLDATNIVEPLVSVITSIGFDHCEMLGDTLEKIAAEKAGIIKPGRPVVIGRMPEPAERTIRAIAAERGSSLVSVADEFGDDIERYPHTNLEGDYQRWNAATATIVASLVPGRWRLSTDVVERGLKRVDWPGRWQRLHVGGQLVILDTSHNSEGAQVLESNLTHLFSETGRLPIIIAGALGASRAQPLLEVVCRHAREVRLVVPNQARACTHAELEALLPRGFQGPVLRSTVDELFPTPDLCTAAGSGDPIVVTGSVYLIGEVLARLEPNRGHGEGRLQDF
jgi:dihydrofolate synthase / folylpolyglutamate synthase